MTETLPLVLAWTSGTALGALFFGGLWLTIRKGISSPHPARWFMGSLLLRMSLTLAGFYLVGSSHWQRLLACLLGFIMARFIMAWLTRERDAIQIQESSHAP